jgi:hypothetical protein
MAASYRDRGLTTLEGILDRCVLDGGCVVFTGRPDNHGYGQAYYDGRKRRVVHRLVYEAIVGDVPEGLVLDHVCRNRLCVNPQHLEPVTVGENVTRGWVARKEALHG